MRALSIRQPWAWAILNAEKRIENRSRADGRMPSLCSYRGPLLIHASAGCTQVEWHDAASWMHLHDLANMRPSRLGLKLVPPLTDLPRGGIVGVCNVVAHVDPMGVAWSDPRDKGPCNPPDLRWWARGYGLVLVDVRALPFVPFKGALGFFDVPDELVQPLLAEGGRGGHLEATRLEGHVPERGSR